jgi:hypothetical protein
MEVSLPSRRGLIAHDRVWIRDGLGVHDRARENVSTWLRPLLQQTDIELVALLGSQLLQTDSRANPAGPAPTTTTSYSIASRAPYVLSISSRLMAVVTCTI